MGENAHFCSQAIANVFQGLLLFCAFVYSFAIGHGLLLEPVSLSAIRRTNID
jgi:hypothetical protein